MYLLGTSHNSSNCHQLPCHYFPESHWWCEISSLSKVILVLGKARDRRAPNLGCRGAESRHGLMFRQKLYTKCDGWVGTLSWWSCQSPVAHSCSLVNHPNSFHGAMFKLNTKFEADSLLYSLSHFEYHGHTVHMLTPQHLLRSLTGTVKSSLFSHVHSIALSLAARLHQCRTNHLTLTMAGHFVDRPHTCVHTYTEK